MKKSLLILSLTLSLFTKGQDCRFHNPIVGIATSCHSVCLPGTFKIDTSFCNWFVMTGTGASSYTWTNGSIVVPSPTITYMPTYPGVTNYTVTGMITLSPGQTCTAQAVISVTAVICTHSVRTGLEEEREDPAKLTRTYFDLQGNRIKPRPGELMIEQVGTRRRKVVILE